MDDEGALDVLVGDLIDHVLPTVPPYEFALYMLLLRMTDFRGGEVRIGKRTIGARLGKGTRSSQGNYQHIGEKLQSLATSGFITIGDTTREGTRYEVRTPDDVPAIAERKASAITPEEEPDYYEDPQLRATLLERDGWRCRYCGELVTTSNATLDHVIPRSLGGPNTAENLVAACLACNSIKSGRTYEEAAPQLLAELARRRSGA
jgi:HNH endonuclease